MTCFGGKRQKGKLLNNSNVDVEKREYKDLEFLNSVLCAYLSCVQHFYFRLLSFSIHSISTSELLAGLSLTIGTKRK